MRLVTSAVLALVLASPAGALAAVGYRCGTDAQVRSSCCCPDQKATGAVDEAAACPEVQRPECCETVAQPGATVSSRTLIQPIRILTPMSSALAAAAAAPLASQLSVDSTRPDLPPGRASPAFLSHCSLLL